MNDRSKVGRALGVVLLTLAAPAHAYAQGAPPAPSPAPVRLSMTDAIRLALDRNQSLRAQRLTVDEAKADEVTAALKPNLFLSASFDGLPVFSPSQLTTHALSNDVTYTGALDYTFERGGKRKQRTTVARDTTMVTTQTVTDAERQLRFDTAQAFINVLLAKSTLDLAQQNLGNFSNIVDINRQRVAAGDLSQADFLKISLQQLQFQQDVVERRRSRWCRPGRRCGSSWATTRCPRTSTSWATWRTRSTPLTLGDLEQAALANRARPAGGADRHDARAGRGRARASATARATWTARLDYDEDRAVERHRRRASRSTLPFHDRNQGNIAHAEVAARQAAEVAAASRAAVLTDVDERLRGVPGPSDQVIGALPVGLSRPGAAVARHQHLRVSARGRQPARPARRRADLPRHPAGAIARRWPHS